VKKYNDYGQVIEQEDAPGVVTYFDYNAKTGILSKHVNPAGRMIKYEFNEQGLPVKKIGLGKNEEFQMEYDSLGRLTGLIDPANVTYSVQYDSWGNIQKVSSNSGWEIFYEFDIWGRQKTFVDTEGNRKEIFYDDQAQERKTVYPDGSVKIEKYNLAGQIIQEIWNKRVTAYQYDGMGRVVQIRDPGNRVASFEYDALGNLVRQKDFTDREYVYEYDAILRLTSEKTAGSDATTRYDYQKDFGSEQKLFSSYYTHKVYPDGETLTRKFDHFMRPLEIVETTGDKKEFSYDNLGNLIKVRKNEFQETVYSYDQAGNLESIFKPGNIIFLFEYNWRNQITAAADPEGHIYSYYYNDNGQLERVLNAEKQTSSFFYDSNGNLTAFQFPSGLTYRYGYDQMNRLAIISKGEDELTEITYDEYGQILSIAHSSGMFEIREHDLIGNLTSVTYPDESSIEYSYDSQGRRKAVKGADFSKTYDYDQESRLIKLTVNQLPFSFSYTKGGKISKISFPDLYIISYEYDTYGRVKDIQDSTGDKVVFKYDMGTRLQSLLYSNRITETFGYNDRGLISRIRVSNYKEEKIFDADFDYNFMDVISEITSTEHQGEKQSNIYQDDSMLRVVQERADDKQNTYRYDVNGNLLEESTLFGTLKRGYADKNGNRLEKIYDSLYSGGTYVPLFGVMPKRPPEYVNVNNNVCQIDKEKNMFFLDKFKLNSGENVLDITAIDRIGYKESLKVKVFLDEQATVSLGYYPSGNIQYISKKGALTAFEWNDKNRLERIINDRREVTTFDYYEDGRLASIVDDYGDKTQYIYAPEGKLLAEVHGKNTISSKYVYAPDGRVLFKVEAGGKKFFYHLLPDGSINVITDRFGNIAKQYSYDIFGNVTGETGRVKNNLLYKGMFFDDFSGMYFYGNRYYSPEYRIITGGGMDGVRFTENHLFPFSSLLGIPVLEMHPEEAVMPLKMLKKEIILHNEP
ncbi:MAG: hypothetical protein JW928_09565, partial [Candidatus Aureabacteria bacterium]|nr:hypothetical protein [Candidatus Auribacterota bacterium]